GALLFSWGCKNDASSGSNGNGPGGSATRPESPGEGNRVEGDVIKVGVIASLNGELKPWGEDSVRGIQMAVDEFNAAGGVNGKKVQLVIEDTASKPEVGKTATEKLVSEDKVVAILGEIASGITQPAAQVAFQYGVPIISPGSTRVDITNIGNNVFRVCFTDNFQGAAMAKFAYEDLGLRRIAILTDKKLPYSTGLSDVFRQAFTDFGGEIVDEQFYESGTMDFKPQLTNIKAKNPDGLFCSGYFNEVGPIARQKEIVGLNVVMLGGDGWDSAKLLTSGGRGIIGGYWTNHYSNYEKRPQVQRFIQAFKERFGSPPATAMAPLGYDAALVLLDALKRAESLDSKAITKAIAETANLEAVSGTITIGRDGNAEKSILVLQVTEEARDMPVKRIEFFRFEPKQRPHPGTLPRGEGEGK
ncbi:MAG: ethanolamine utilization protein EutJ, partial [Armatimonadota bacterium]